MKKTLDFDDYKHCLFTNASVTGQKENVYRKQLMFQNRLHKVYTVEVNKVVLNTSDDKRIVQKDFSLECLSMVPNQI